MALPQLAGITTKIAGAPPRELRVVNKQLNLVITSLDDAVEALEKLDFDAKAHISPAALGGGQLSPLLASHHSRAHGVTADTLRDVRSDLAGFREAIKEARVLLASTDEESEAQFRTTLNETDGLDMGQYANERSQVTHASDPVGNLPADPATEGDL